MKIAIAVAGLLVLVLPNHSSAQVPSPRERIAAIAASSSCASVNWANRGRAPKAYIRGVALVFAKAVCQPERADVKVVSAAREIGTAPERTDALAWYDTKFQKLAMSNAESGIGTLRHAYALLIGLGMQESSGMYCTGRDRSADFTTADSAEAGLFQTSWGAHVTHPSLAQLFDTYKADQSGCWLEVFRQNVSCSAWDARTWGEGPGAEWQKLTKACPVFATEYGAVVIRKHGGSKGEFGPIRHGQAEVRQECDTMLSQVQDFVQSDPLICSSLK